MDLSININNTGDILLEGNPQDIVKKAECFVHFTYVKSGEQLVGLDIQGNESTLTDPEIATKTLCDEEEQIFFILETSPHMSLNGSLFLTVATNSVS